MARSFKNLLGDDSVTTRTLLHEAIPITGTISSGTYNSGDTDNIRKFDSDGTLDDSTGTMNHSFFMNFSRLLTKDEIKKNTFRLGMFISGAITGDGSTRSSLKTIGDYLSANQFRTSPAGDYGLLFTGSTATAGEEAQSVGLIFYQAGIAVLTSSLFTGQIGFASTVESGSGAAGTFPVDAAQTGSVIETLADSFRHRLYDIDFNNTIELNSQIYFCRINHNEYNYSANPTYVSGSKIRVKNNVNDLPVSYITTVGLYSPDNELMAVAKLSEPIRKDPNTELTLRVRLDY